MSRYSRQLLLPQIGPEGQARLSRGRVLILGCGALGTVVAEQLCRAGVGFIRIVDRDIVEDTNLQRQTLFDESDARAGTPKAVAAAARLNEVNSDVAIDPLVMHVGPDEIESVARDVDLLLDGTDNVATRFLMNDAAIKLGKPWVYGACVGVEGRVMPVIPGGPCLRCVFREPPSPGELPTCDTAGVLAGVAGVVGSWQAVAALRLLTGSLPDMRLLKFDVWEQRAHLVDVSDARQPDCPCCSLRQFTFLESRDQRAASLCGRDAVQIRAPAGTSVDLDALAARLAAGAPVERTPFFVKLVTPDALRLTIFPDGRAMVQGTSELIRAQRAYDRFVGG